MNKFKKQDSRTLDWAEQFARLMDSQYRLPGTGFKFGLDPVIGLIPGLRLRW